MAAEKIAALNDAARRDFVGCRVVLNRRHRTTVSRQTFPNYPWCRLRLIA